MVIEYYELFNIERFSSKVNLLVMLYIWIVWGKNPSYLSVYRD